jgi:hypothetical protein
MSDHPEARNGFVNSSVKYEPTDLSLRAVLAFSAALVLVLIVVSVGLYFLIPAVVGPIGQPRPLASWDFKPEPGPSPDASHLPAKPELEAIDRTAQPQSGDAQTRPVGEQIKQEEARLNSYGETDVKGIFHIPIEEAMKRMAGMAGGQP